MQRSIRRILYDKKAWLVRGLFPADFLNCSYWPFSFYHLPEDQKEKSSTDIARNWKLKPAKVNSEEEKLAESVKQAFNLSLGLKTDSEYAGIKKDETLHTVLLSEIYALTYVLTPIEKIFTPVKTISRDFSEALAIKTKTMGIEPYSIMADLTQEKPELFNPKRFDFNWFILGMGWERERREYEKAQAEIKSKYNLRKR